MKTFVFRIVVDTEEDIFRDIELREDQNFEDLHDALIHAFGFEGDQMASFYMSNENWEKGEEISLMDVGLFEGEQSSPSMKGTLISHKISEKNQKVLYVYDFLKMWIFYIEVIHMDVVSNDKVYPAILREFGEAPDENDKDFPDIMEGIDLGGGSDPEEDDLFDDDPFDEFEDGYEDYGNYDDF